MTRHHIAVHLSRAQLEYVVEVVDEDLESGDLTVEGRERANSVRRKLADAEQKIAVVMARCDDTCACRRTRAQR